jgi:hypothetical protein
MATTDALLAYRVFEALSEAEVEWCLLHGAGDLASGSITDIDLALAQLDSEGYAKFHAALLLAGCHVVSVWPSGIGTLNLFIMTEDLGRGIQVDLLIDETGASCYGICTPVVVGASRKDGRVIHASEMDSWLYVLRKRIRKQQHDRVAEHLAVPVATRAELVKRASDIFSRRNSVVVQRALNGSAISEIDQPGILELMRKVRRVVRFGGLWIHMSGPEAPQQATSFSERMGRVARSTYVGDTQRMLNRVRCLPKIAQVLIRSGIVVTWGGDGRLAHLRVDAGLKNDEISRQILSVADRRSERLVRWWLPRLV